MLGDLIKIKDKVRYVLENYPKTRDCDKHLWLAYMCIFHNLKQKMGDVPYKIFRDMFLSSDVPVTESVRRVRQKFQEEGLYTGTKRKEKLIESSKVREYYQ